MKIKKRITLKQIEDIQLDSTEVEIGESLIQDLFPSNCTAFFKYKPEHYMDESIAIQNFYAQKDGEEITVRGLSDNYCLIWTTMKERIEDKTQLVYLVVFNDGTEKRVFEDEIEQPVLAEAA